MNELVAIVLMLNIAWFGITFVYFIRYLRINTEHEITSFGLMISFLGDLKNIYRFYQMFFDAHKNNKYGKRLTYFLIGSNIISYVSFPVIVIIAAIYSF